MNAVQRDKCFGRRLARAGAAAIVTRHTRVPDPFDRVIHWRSRARQPGIGNALFKSMPVSDQEQPVSPQAIETGAFSKIGDRQ